MELSELIAHLQNPASFPDSSGPELSGPKDSGPKDSRPKPSGTGREASVELKQTHISVVCLVGDVVYKIRKPVRFAFLDFGTLAQRHADCLREVELNQRLAADVYLGVVPLTMQGGRLQVGAVATGEDAATGQGEVIEWAVKMRRLDDEATLEHRLAQGQVTPEICFQLGRRLADFHQSAARSSHISSFGRYEVVARNAFDNLEIAAQSQAAEYCTPELARCLARQTRESLQRLRPLIDARAERGVPCDTHGDLRVDHVYLFPEQPPPADLCVIDCIEFNDSFRYADPVADIAFLAMDLMFHGAQQLAASLIDGYFQAADDPEGRELLPFYISYRAAVRGKVETLAAGETEIPPAQRERASQRARAYWLLAWSALLPPQRRPCLILVGGLQGTGKSTLARHLAEAVTFHVIRTDVVRKELAGLTGAEACDKSRSSHLYTADWSERTYEACLERARAQLLQGKRVLLDGMFSRKIQRQPFLELARTLRIPMVYVHCHAAPEVARQRLEARRGDPSDATWETYLATVERWEPLSELEAQEQVSVETSASTTDVLPHLIEHFRRLQLW